MTEIQIPAGTMPVVRVLRKDVSRPDPYELSGEVYCRFPSEKWEQECCPMGLDDNARCPCPLTQYDFAKGKCSTKEIKAFGIRWWDNLTLPQAKQAVDLIWPESQPT